MSGRDLIIGLDAGTSVIKAVAFTLDGQQVGSAGVANKVDYLDDGGAEQEVQRTWTDAARALRLLAEQVPDLAHRTAALAITGQGDGTWLIDADGEPVCPAWLWLDARSAPIIEGWRASDIGPKLQEITGTAINPAIQSGQLAWLKQHRPESLRRAASALHCKDWLYFKATGARATDPSEGVFTFGNYRTRAYDDAVLELLDLQDIAHLRPGIVDGLTHHAPLAREAADAVGLRTGTPVVLGPIDVIATALGAGAYEPGRRVGMSILGSTGMHIRLYHHVDEVVLSPEQVGYVVPFVVPGTWGGLQSHMAATLNIDWLVNIAARLAELAGADSVDRRDLLANLDRQAANARPGTLLFHPFISENGERGPFVEPRARAQFLGLSTRTGPGDMMRAVYEGMAFASRDCYRVLDHQPEEIRLAGGAANSALCRKILAAATGAPIRIVERAEAGAAGAALTAAVSIGRYDSIAGGLKDWVTPYLGDLEQVDEPLAAIYDRLFPAYRDGYLPMKNVWQALHQSVRGS
ncbi:MAG: carbohydrate kinase [Rhizobiales bacterium]|nr:carbohydrate kinase [Hyphomicrobiales bacterium]